MQKIILKINSEEFEWLDEKSDCYILNSVLPAKFITDFYQKASALDKIVLVEGENALRICKELNLDGVIIDLSSAEEIKEEMENARKEIGRDKLFGVIARTRRHEAMLVSENEPDFVVFKVWNDGADKIAELIDWYEEFFLLQLAIMPQDEEVVLKEFGADIIILDTKKYKIFVDKNESLD